MHNLICNELHLILQTQLEIFFINLHNQFLAQDSTLELHQRLPFPLPVSTALWYLDCQHGDFCNIYSWCLVSLIVIMYVRSIHRRVGPEQYLGGEKSYTHIHTYRRDTCSTVSYEDMS